MCECACKIAMLNKAQVDLDRHPFTNLTCGEAIAEVGQLGLSFTSCPYLSFLRKIHGLEWRQTQRECPGKFRAKLTKVWTKKIDLFRSGGEHSSTGDEHSPIRAHASTRSRSCAWRKHTMLSNLWLSNGLWRWVILSNNRTFSLPSLLWLGFGATACV